MSTQNVINDGCLQERRGNTSLVTKTLIAIALTLLVLPAMAADWVARHGLTSTQYQQTFEKYTSKGYRLTSVSGYESRQRAARYAAIWKKQSGPAWSARHGLTSRQYQNAFEDFARKGYRLTFVNGYSVRNKAYYAGIWEKKTGPASSARHGLTSQQYQSVVTDMVGKGYMVTHVSAFSINGSPQFAAIFEKNAPKTAARHGLSASAYQRAFNDFSRKGYRLKIVTGYKQGNSDRYAAIWTKTGGPQWSARHGIPNKHYQPVFDNYTYQSWEPQYVEAFNSAKGVRFNGVWQNTTFKSGDLALINRKVKAYMKANDVPGLSIAIMRNEKLVYASGFGRADKETGEPVGTSHRFRVASVSKPITHVAVERLIKETNLQRSSKVFGSSSVLGGQYATPSNNPDIVDITVQNLIDHRGGWVNINKNGDASDPMFAYTGSDHKGLIKWTLKNYPLGSKPDSERKYSNFGYCLLGRVIEAKTGKGYMSYVRDKILKPAGANGIIIGGDKAADRKRNEVKYYGGGAYSSVKPTRFDSHGGWIATPIDLLRFMRHENVLGTPYAHNGAMGGTKAVFRRRSDGFGYAGLSNTSAGGTDQINALLKEIVEGVSSWPNTNLF